MNSKTIAEKGRKWKKSQTTLVVGAYLFTLVDPAKPKSNYKVRGLWRQPSVLKPEEWSFQVVYTWIAETKK